jgi:hypothetical protein
MSSEAIFSEECRGELERVTDESLESCLQKDKKKKANSECYHTVGHQDFDNKWKTTVELIEEDGVSVQSGTRAYYDEKCGEPLEDKHDEVRIFSVFCTTLLPRHEMERFGLMVDLFR